jgi:chemotaxis protein methyltransferase CheR
LNCEPQDPAFRRLKRNLIASTGLAFYTERDTLLGEVIGARLGDLGLRDCAAYSKFLAEGAEGEAEMEVLIGQLTIGETYFFRDEEQFAAIQDFILPDILRRNRSKKELRIWSAGCSNGAEPYSLAILLAHKMASRIAGWNVAIYASDLNRSFLAQAAAGKYRAWALRATPEEIKRECFSKQGQVWAIAPRYQELVTFHHINLVQRQFTTPWPAGTHLDLILCRNVMIYFAPEGARRLIGEIHGFLADGGWLMVGGAESNSQNYQAFRAQNFHGARLFQKMAAAPVPAEAVAKPQAVVETAQQGMKAEASAILRKQPDAEGLRQLADCGDWQSAVRYGQRLLERDRLNPSTHFYQALIFENLGIPSEAARFLRQAIYLDRNFALAHYHMGLALERDRHPRAASRCFANVLRVLGDIPGDEAVRAGPGITVSALRELTRRRIAGSPGARP